MVRIREAGVPLYQSAEELHRAACLEDLARGFSKKPEVYRAFTFNIPKDMLPI